MTSLPRLIFMGSCDFSSGILRGLLTLHQQGMFQLVGVFTKPPKVQGRGHLLHKTSVHQMAEHHHLPVFTPTTLRDPCVLEEVRHLRPDLGVVASYGMLLPEAFLALPPLGYVNVHPSLLPAWRGASPMTSTLLSGDSETGISLMQLDVGMDTGPLLAQKCVSVPPQSTGPTLSAFLQTCAVDMLSTVLPDYMMGRIVPCPQAPEGATYTRKILKEDGYLRWTSPADILERQVRAFQPWPSSWFMWNQKRVQVLEACVGPCANSMDTSPGTVVRLTNGGISIVCAEGSVFCPLRVKPEGKKVMDIASFVRGYCPDLSENLSVLL